jgi:hypothetical protein
MPYWQEPRYLSSHPASFKYQSSGGLYLVASGRSQAELLGLRRRDIDLILLSISVSQVLYKRRGICTFKEPKTSHSRRGVAMTSKLALFLKEYQTEREWL